MTNEHPTLRRALRLLAGDPPPPLGHLGPAAERLAHRIRRRRRVTTAASGALAVGVVVAVVGASVPSGSTQLVGAAGDPPFPTLPVPSSLLPAPLPTGSPTPTPTKPTPSPSPTSSVSPSPTRTSPDNRPLRVTVMADPRRTETARLGTFTIQVHRRPGTVLRTVVEYGDGRVVDDWATYGPYCPQASADDPTDYEVTLRHAFRAAGTYDVTVTVQEMATCTEGGDSARDAVRVDVAPGAVLSNGPFQPVLYAKSVSPSTEQGNVLTGQSWLVHLKASVRDDDGWITRLTVDWGDGTEPEVQEYGTSGCTDTPTDWPQSSKIPQLEHAYQAQGDYQVTVTVTTTGCDGADAQAAQAKPLVHA